MWVGGGVGEWGGGRDLGINFLDSFVVDILYAFAFYFFLDLLHAF